MVPDASTKGFYGWAVTPIRFPRLHDAGWLCAQFDAGRSIDDVAADIGVHRGTVVAARRRHGLSKPRAPRRPVDVDAVRHGLENGLSLGAIGRQLGHTSSAISKVVRRHGLTRGRGDDVG